MPDQEIKTPPRFQIESAPELERMERVENLLEKHLLRLDGFAGTLVSMSDEQISTHYSLVSECLKECTEQMTATARLLGEMDGILGDV